MAGFPYAGRNDRDNPSARLRPDPRSDSVCERPPARWSISNIADPEERGVDVASWGRNLGLEQYEAAFRENSCRTRRRRHRLSDSAAVPIAAQRILDSSGSSAERRRLSVTWPQAYETDAETRRATGLAVAVAVGRGPCGRAVAGWNWHRRRNLWSSPS